MPALVADTHAAIWYLQGSAKLSTAALSAIRGAASAGDPVYLSAITLVEATFLVEKGKLPAVALSSLEAALEQRDADFEVMPLNSAVARTLQRVPRDLVPDMPDRIIAATALNLGLPLVTRDRNIRASGIETIW